jgi:hypothetical protein
VVKEIFEANRIEYREHGQHHHGTCGWVQTDCPFCSPRQGKFRMGWNLSYGYCNCWTCGPHNRVEALSLLLGVSKRDAWKLLGSIDFQPEVKKELQG